MNPDYIYLPEKFTNAANRIERMLDRQNIQFARQDSEGDISTFRLGDDEQLIVQPGFISVCFPASAEVQHLITMKIRACIRKEPLRKNSLAVVEWKE